MVIALPRESLEPKVLLLHEGLFFIINTMMYNDQQSLDIREIMDLDNGLKLQFALN
jgi:hypothetical protein